jgi:hypothetical protein
VRAGVLAISPATSGTWAATGAIMEFQQFSFARVLKL